MNIIKKIYVWVRKFFTNGNPQLISSKNKDYYTIPDPDGSIYKILNSGYIISYEIQPCLKCKNKKLKFEKSFKNNKNFSKAICKKCGFEFIVEIVEI